MPIFFEKKQLVTPGELLAEGEYLPGENTYVEQNKIYAARIGLVDTDNKKVTWLHSELFMCLKWVTSSSAQSWKSDLTAGPSTLKHPTQQCCVHQTC